MSALSSRSKVTAGKILAMMLISFMCVTLFARTVSADTGPKRSITINIINPPDEPYYIAILRQGNMPYSESMGEYVDDSDEDAWIINKIYSYNEDGYVMFSYGGGAPSVESSEKDIKDKGYVKYNYMVPTTFKVIVVTKSGEVTVSDEITSKAFYADFQYDYSQNTIKEIYYEAKFSENLAINSLFFFGVTLVTEGIVLLCFGLFRKKNLLRFFIVNVITQVLLFAFNLTSKLYEPMWQKYLLFWVIVEAVITVIETLLYCKKLVKKDGTVSVGRNIAYAVTANVISAFGDLPIVFIATLMH